MKNDAKHFMKKLSAHEMRRRIIVSSALLNIGSKGCQFSLMLVAFAVTLPYLGPERFGVFSTILGFGSILAILDLGIGNVLIGSVARLNADGDKKLIGSEILNGLFLLTVLGLIFLLALGLVAAYVPVDRLFKGVSDQQVIEIRWSLFVFFAAFSITLPIQGLQRITQGLQKSYISHAFSIAFCCMSAIFLYFAVKNHASIPMLLLVAYVIPAVAPLCTLYFILPLASHGHLSKITLVDAAHRYFKDGGIFFLLQLGALAGWGIDTLLAANQLGAASAGIYAITQRLFQLLTYPLAIVNLPLWPAYADANARGDRDFINSSLKKSFILTIATAVVGSLFLLLFSRYILAAWFQREIIIPWTLLCFFSIWAVFEAAGNSYAMFMNGMNFLKLQLYPNIGFFLLAIPLKIYLIKHMGLAGLPLGTLIAYICAIFLPYLLYIKPHKRLS
jgi:O-antigen/teichoic acid export membrane protein